MDIEAPKTPNTGRIIDVWLGGSHHFPLDAAAAAGFERAAPVFPAMFRELRAFTERAVRFVHAQGVNRFLVLGAGIPSQGNVHNTVPEANVLYTDIDAHNIRLGQEILAGSTRAAYAHCDASDLDTLDMALFERVLGTKEPIGVVFGGIAAFIPDDKLASSLRRLYDLSPSGSYLVIDFDSDESHKHPEMLQRLMSEPAVAAASAKTSIRARPPPSPRCSAPGS